MRGGEIGIFWIQQVGPSRCFSGPVEKLVDVHHCLSGDLISGLLDKSYFRLWIFCVECYKSVISKSSSLYPEKWILPSKRCFCWLFVASWSIKLFFLYLPSWLISLFQDLPWLIHNFRCILGNTTPNTFLIEKVWLHRYRPKRLSRGIFSLCVVTVLEQIKWTNYSAAISVSLGRTLTVFWPPLQVSSTVCDQIHSADCVCVGIRLLICMAGFREALLER